MIQANMPKWMKKIQCGLNHTQFQTTPVKLVGVEMVVFSQKGYNNFLLSVNLSVLKIHIQVTLSKLKKSYLAYICIYIYAWTTIGGKRDPEYEGVCGCGLIWEGLEEEYGMKQIIIILSKII